MDSIPWDGNQKRKSKAGYSFGSAVELEMSWNVEGWVPDGVIIVTAGGLKGYSGGNLRVPATKVNNTGEGCMWEVQPMYCPPTN
jgi:hypothetical protein